MREIEFRGKILFDNEQWKWITGDLEHFTASDGREMVRIRPKSGHKEIVIQKTVGQYIGLKDDNGVKIYEGDVVDVVPILGIHFRGVVKFNSHTSAFDVFREERGDSACLKDDFSVEVRGNVFDNPEFKKYKEVYFRED